MDKILSLDPAVRKLRDFGCCLIEPEGQGEVRVSFPTASSLGIENPPVAGQTAKAIAKFCKNNQVRLVFIDGPQGWKDPASELKYCRHAEKINKTPGKTGTIGNVLPRPFKRFVEFSIALFKELAHLGGSLVEETNIYLPSSGFLVVESFPTAASKNLGMKRPAHPLMEDDLQRRLEHLKKLFKLSLSGKPGVHELAALVAGLAGISILDGRPEGYVADGAPPKEIDGVIFEGFIVNPVLSVEKDKSPALARSPLGQPNTATLERMLYYLKLTRAAEDRIERVLYRQGKIVGGVYTGRGQEAIGVGSAIQLVDGDVVLPSHRDFSSFVIRGFTLREIFLNWMGRAEGPTRGRDNTLHIGNLKRGVIPIISHLGDTCPVACGVAMTLKWRGKKNVAMVHFGEGTTSRGDVHEAMNMASVMALPVIFICNNNGYAYSTPTKKQYVVKDLSVRGTAYAMPGLAVDGNDVLAVYATMRKAIERARAGHGPSFIECRTFRMAGHSAHDGAEYVPKELLAQWAKRDPILQFENILKAKGAIKPERIQEIEKTIQKEIDEAVAFAESSPLPEGASAVEGVYCGPECWWGH